MQRAEIFKIYVLAKRISLNPEKASHVMKRCQVVSNVLAAKRNYASAEKAKVFANALKQLIDMNKLVKYKSVSPEKIYSIIA